jgi:hypothetical protein
MGNPNYDRARARTRAKIGPTAPPVSASQVLRLAQEKLTKLNAALGGAENPSILGMIDQIAEKVAELRRRVS